MCIYIYVYIYYIYIYIHALLFYLFIYFVFEKKNLSSLFLEIGSLKWCQGNSK